MLTKLVRKPSPSFFFNVLKESKIDVKVYSIVVDTNELYTLVFVEQTKSKCFGTALKMEVFKQQDIAGELQDISRLVGFVN